MEQPLPVGLAIEKAYRLSLFMIPDNDKIMTKFTAYPVKDKDEIDTIGLVYFIYI